MCTLLFQSSSNLFNCILMPLSNDCSDAAVVYRAGKKMQAIFRKLDTPPATHAQEEAHCVIARLNEYNMRETRAFLIPHLTLATSALADECASYSALDDVTIGDVVNAPPDDVVKRPADSVSESVSSSRGDKYATWRTGSMEWLVRDNSGTSEVEAERSSNSVKAATTHEVNKALYDIIDIVKGMDKVLRTRFQKRGEAYLESLGHLFNYPVGEVTERRDIAIKEATVDELCLPAAVYEVSVIRMFGPNGIIFLGSWA